ncbi:MAG: methyltransferase domain-containing protein [Bacteroidales bacterium]
MTKSVEFTWEINSVNQDLELIKKDEAVELTIKYLNNNFSFKILEAGSGNGRVVRYLSDLGYKNIEGIELNREIVALLNKKFTDLKIYQGDIIIYDFKKTYDFIISYGVVEHFVEGVNIPLKKFYQILNSDGIAVLTIPCFNYYRRMRYILSRINPKNYNRNRNAPGKNGFLYNVSPLYGSFFEYWLTPTEFNYECIKSGFKILFSMPISHAFGTYQIFGKLAGNYMDGEIRLNKFGKLLNMFLKLFPYFHNHMYAIVLRK